MADEVKNSSAAEGWAEQLRGFEGSHTGADQEGRDFHPSTREADHERGVSLICPWEEPYSGFAEHSRRLARALDDAGIPTHMRSLDASMQMHTQFELGGKDKIDLREEYADLLDKSIKHYMVSIYHLVPDDAELQVLTTHRHLTPEQLEWVNSYKIISTVWERDRISPAATQSLNRVGQVWTSTSQHAAMLAECGVASDKIRVILLPYAKDDPLFSLRSQKRMKGVPRFYHIGKWEPRKAQHEMLGCFLRAFKPGEAKLYLKTSETSPRYDNYPRSPDLSIESWLSDEGIRDDWTLETVNQNIHVIKKRISPAQIFQLHRMGDIYLSLSRGEGWDMPAYDSMLAGNRLVFTPSGGPQEYADGATSYQVQVSGSVPVNDFYNWGDAEYLGWSMEDAVKQMRRSARDVSEGLPAEVKADLAEFSPSDVGSLMRRSIEELVQKNEERWGE